MGAKALLISTDDSLRESIAQAMAPVADCELRFAPGLGEARQLFEQFQPTVVFYHIATGQSECPATEAQQELASSGGTAPFVAIADQHEVSHALSLLRAGATDYLARPINLNRITMLAEVLSLRTAPVPVAECKSSVEAIGPERDFLYGAAAMKVLVNRAQRVAQLESTVLLSGETGTGKTRIARLIHELSNRAHEPFVCVNCGSLSPSLIESELFGHIRGAFTGADRDRAGKCATAGKGTLLLDEVDSLPMDTQSKLLRAVDERLFEPVGSDHSQRLDARLIVATNRPLEQDVKQGRFRADLFYRVNVLSLQLPPLRERRDEIQALVESNVQRFAEKTGTTIPDIAPATMRAMREYDWPGNIRELQNVVERAVAFGGSRIELSDLPESLQDLAEPINGNRVNGVDHNGHDPTATCEESKLGQSRSEAESQVILDALTKNANNRSRAARDLGISRVTLYKKLHKYGLI